MVVEQLKKNGLPGEVVTVKTTAEAKRFIDERQAEEAAKYEKTFTDRWNAVEKVSKFIGSVLSGTNIGKSIKIDLPENINKLAEQAVGHKINSHRIKANEIIHARNRHGITGTGNTESSIPLRDSDFTLMPYIMTAPTRVEKGTTAVNGTESVRYEKELSDGVVVVVEREGRFDVENMENITMWATKKSATKVADAKQASHNTSETIVLSEADVAKIKKDAETAIKNNIKSEDTEYQYQNKQGISDKQYEKASEVLKALHDAGFNDFHISRSITDFGVSTYIQGQLGLKFRISDHGVTRIDRILNEIHFGYDTTIQSLVDEAKKADSRAKERAKAFDADEERTRLANEKWDRIKSHFNGVVFKRNNRTYQDYETFRNSGERPRTNILQTEQKGGYGQKAFSYEWTEPTEYNKWGFPTNEGANKPSRDFIEAFDENSLELNTTRYHAVWHGSPHEFKSFDFSNYVIFDEKDMTITNHTQWALKPNGEIAGATLPDGTVILVRDNMTIDTPFHEFAHKLRKYAKSHSELANLAAAIDKYAAEAPQHIKEYVKRTYGYKTESDAYMDEAYAWALSMQNKDKLFEFLKERGVDTSNITRLAETQAWYHKMWNAVKRLWDGVKNYFAKDNGTEYADLSVFDAYEKMSAQEIGDKLYDVLMGGKELPKFDNRKTDSELQNYAGQYAIEGDVDANGNVRPEVLEEIRQERADIEAKAKADGTFMKAPNGKATNLNEKQWLQVRTKAFKQWFGDWEKAARVEKLRKSKAVEITGKEVEPSEDLREYRKRAKDYGKKILKGEYTNKDTNTLIRVSNKSIDEVTSHNLSVAQLQSVAAIPNLIENSIYLDTQENTDKSKRFDINSYDYYVAGLKIGGEDYTAKLVIANSSNGVKYYDHNLTQIEKGDLIQQAGKIRNLGRETSPLSDYKDRKLISLLQTNSSKVVDENGEPMVVYHGTQSAGFNIFDKRFMGRNATGDGHGFYFTTDRSYAKGFSGEDGKMFTVYLDISRPISKDKLTITRLQAKKILQEINSRQKEDGIDYFLSNYGDVVSEGYNNVLNEALDLEYGSANNDVEFVGGLVNSSGNLSDVIGALEKVTGRQGIIVDKGDQTHYIVGNPNGNG